jgi:TolB protein
VIRLTDSPSDDFDPAWLPDGTRIAYRDGNREIYVMNVDGSGQTRLAESRGTEESPAWSPVPWATGQTL